MSDCLRHALLAFAACSTCSVLLEGRVVGEVFVGVLAAFLLELDRPSSARSCPTLLRSPLPCAASSMLWMVSSLPGLIRADLALYAAVGFSSRVALDLLTGERLLLPGRSGWVVFEARDPRLLLVGRILGLLSAPASVLVLLA